MLLGNLFKPLVCTAAGHIETGPIKTTEDVYVTNQDKNKDKSKDNGFVEIGTGSCLRCGNIHQAFRRFSAPMGEMVDWKPMTSEMKESLAANYTLLPRSSSITGGIHTYI